jgi:hypothetical protein
MSKTTMIRIGIAIVAVATLSLMALPLTQAMARLVGGGL